MLRGASASDQPRSPRLNRHDRLSTCRVMAGAGSVSAVSVRASICRRSEARSASNVLVDDPDPLMTSTPHTAVCTMIPSKKPTESTTWAATKVSHGHSIWTYVSVASAVPVAAAEAEEVARILDHRVSCKPTFD